MLPLTMTEDPDRANLGPRLVGCASTNPASKLNSNFDHDEPPYPVRPAEIKQVFHFLAFTLREGIKQTVHALIQSLKCTYLLVSELHRPYVDSVRVLVPLWLAVIHGILLVFFVLAHRTITDAIQQFHQSIDRPFARFTAWTDHAVPRVFRPLACHSGSGPSSAPQSDPSSTMAN